ncbi:MAG: ABC transporter substrate-binding protein [Candidatus Eisenbacteria bacterium]
MHGRLTLAAATMAALALGCAPHAEEGGGAITLALRDSFATFDPAFAVDPQQSPFLRLVYEGLVAFDDSGRVVPACARAWQVSNGGQTIRFELHEGLVAADGTPVTAEDFKRGIERLFRPGPLRSPGAPQFVALEGALGQGRRDAPPLGIDAPDARTLVLRLAWPDPFLLEKLAQPRFVVPASAGGEPRPNGPYRLVREGDGYVFVRDEGHRASLGRDDARRARAGVLDTIRVLTGIPARRALLGLESGRIDLLSPIPGEYRERLLRSAAFGHVEAALDPPLTWWLVLNCELAPLARRDARRGVALAIHRPRLPEELGSAFVPLRTFAVDGAAMAPGYDPGQARLAFEAAKFFTGVRAPVTVPRASALAGALDALAPAMARGAVQVDPVAVSRAEWQRALLERRGMSAAIATWQSPTGDGLDDLAARLLNRGLESGWGGNWSWYHPGPGLDSLLLRGLRQADPVTRAAIRDQVAQLLESDLPFVPLASVREAAVFRHGLTGVSFHPRDGLLLTAIGRPARTTRP